MAKTASTVVRGAPAIAPPQRDRTPASRRVVGGRKAASGLPRGSDGGKSADSLFERAPPQHGQALVSLHNGRAGSVGERRFRHLERDALIWAP
jgi:hypothetical protein